MISKELLEEVLGERYISKLVDWFEVFDNTLSTYYDCGKYDEQGRPTGLGMEINIYELTHLCKEWAIRKEYQVSSGFGDEPAYRKANEKCYARLMWKNEQHEESDMYFITETEPEATFLACEWILKQEMDTKNERD